MNNISRVDFQRVLAARFFSLLILIFSFYERFIEMEIFSWASSRIFRAPGTPLPPSSSKRPFTRTGADVVEVAV